MPCPTSLLAADDTDHATRPPSSLRVLPAPLRPLVLQQSHLQARHPLSRHLPGHRRGLGRVQEVEGWGQDHPLDRHRRLLPGIPQ